MGRDVFGTITFCQSPSVSANEDLSYSLSWQVMKSEEVMLLLTSYIAELNLIVY